ncbi:cytochrome P450 [Cadophora sp. DSE1049]|nr:cytochrome P450 [Cadophora sp. DSE1049]
MGILDIDTRSLLLVVVLVGLGFLGLNTVLRAVAVRKFSRKNGCSPPPARTDWSGGMSTLLEILEASRNNYFLVLLRTWHHQYGNTFRTRVAGRTWDFDLGYRNKALSPLLGQGIFASDGSIWEHSRALIRPNFVRNQVADVELYENHVAKLIQHIPRDGSPVDMQELFFRMTLDSATEFLFGESVNSLDDGRVSPTNFAEDFNVSQIGLAVRIRMGPLTPFHFDRLFWKATADARGYVNRFVEQAVEFRKATDNKVLSEKAGQYVFLHELSKRTLDKKELTDQLLNILLAGRDTTAGLLSITFHQLARHPEVWNKLQQEVQNLNGLKPSFEYLKSMKYLSGVINETLRLYPSVPFNMRTANKDTYLPVGGGVDGKSPIFIPKGQEVMYEVYGMHRLTEFYGPDAPEFRPERWETLKPGWAYIPFNSGPQICIGQQFALTETGYSIVRIMQEFKGIKNRDPEPFQEWVTLTLASKHGTKVVLNPA